MCVWGGGYVGPILFLTFINDLPDNIRSSICGQSLANEVQCGQMSLYESDSVRHQHYKQIHFDYSLHKKTLEKFSQPNTLI